MRSRTYRDLYAGLDTTGDIGRLAEKTGTEDWALYAILSLKSVRNARERFHELKRDALLLEAEWSSGKSFVELSREMNFPPVLTASMVLEARGVKKKEFRELLKGSAGDGRVAQELKEAVNEDFLYSPWAHELQRRRAEVGERMLEEWLLGIGADFVREKDARNTRVTPDFLLTKELVVEGRGISWVESKASFGDQQEHLRYMRKQLNPYLEEFGEGMVVYWYGYVDPVSSLEPQILVKDHEFFRGQEIKELLELSRW